MSATQLTLDGFLEQTTDWLIGFEHGRGLRRVRDNRLKAGLRSRRRITAVVLRELVRHVRLRGREPDLKQLTAGLVCGLKPERGRT